MASSYAAGSSTQECTRRFCTSTEQCLPYAQACETAADCNAKSCCAIMDLVSVESGFGNVQLPKGRIDKCGEAFLYCRNNRCVRTDPPWRELMTKLALQQWVLQDPEFGRLYVQQQKQRQFNPFF